MLPIHNADRSWTDGPSILFFYLMSKMLLSKSLHLSMIYFNVGGASNI